MTSMAVYAAAALVEIGGCFAIWAWTRLDKSVLWTVPGVAALIVVDVGSRAWTVAAGPDVFDEPPQAANEEITTGKVSKVKAIDFLNRPINISDVLRTRGRRSLPHA